MHDLGRKRHHRKLHYERYSSTTKPEHKCPQSPNPNINVISGISFILTVAFRPDTIARLSNILFITATRQNMSYWLQEDIHNYRHASQLPALEEFTMCFYFEPNPENLLSIVSREAQIEALISIASEGSITYLIVCIMRSAGC